MNKQEREQIEKEQKITLAIWVLCILMLLAGNLVFGQTKITKSADGVYESVKTERKTEAIKTEHIFRDSKGDTYPIYQSKNGKYFVKRVSKKTGKEYNYYLTETK